MTKNIISFIYPKLNQGMPHSFFNYLFIVFIFIFSFLNDSNAAEVIAIPGLVLSNDGFPVPYALITVEGRNDIRIRTDDEGRFTLKVFQQGIYSLKASIRGDLFGDSELVSIDTHHVDKPLILSVTLTGRMNEIVVTARSPTHQISAVKIRGEELKHVAGTGGDALWAIQSLPGVAIGEDVFSEPAVRGSFPGDNLYYVDFLPVGYLFHVGDSISVLQAPLIRDIGFYPSAFGPEYGDKNGAVFDINLISPNTIKWKRQVDISLLGLNVNAQGPLSKNQSAFFGFRQSYLDLALKAIDYNENNPEDLIEAPTYNDYQGKYVWQIDNSNKLALNLTGANDNLTTELYPDVFTWIVNEEQSYDSQAIVWDRYSGASSNKLAIGYLSNNYRETDGPVQSTVFETTAFFIREQLQYSASEKHIIVLGGDIHSQQRNYYELAIIPCEDPEGCSKEIDNRQRINFAAAYLKDQWSFSKNTILNIGARLSANDFVKRFYLEPRLGVEWNAFPRTTLFTAWGQYNQMPGTRSLLGPNGNSSLQHARSEHTVFGVNYEFHHGWNWKTEIFYKTLWNLLEWNEDNQYNTNSGNGKAYGVELFIKKSLTDKFSGWLSVTGSKSKIENNQRNETFFTRYDQPIIASLVLSSKLENNWFIDLKWYFRSGRPYTPVIDAEPIVNKNTGETSFYRAVFGKINSARYPVYHRMDARISKRMNFSRWTLETYIGVLNLYNRDNVNEYIYSFNYSTKSPTFQLPLFFTFGVNATF